MSAAIAGLRGLIEPPDLIASSPLVRATQTADLFCVAFPGAERVDLDELSPGFDRGSLCNWLESVDRRRVVLVGHEPDLSELVGWLIGGARLHMRKGAVAAVTLDGPAAARRGTLEWLFTRSVLRRIGA